MNNQVEAFSTEQDLNSIKAAPRSVVVGSGGFYFEKKHRGAAVILALLQDTLQQARAWEQTVGWPPGNEDDLLALDMSDTVRYRRESSTRGQQQPEAAEKPKRHNRMGLTLFRLEATFIPESEWLRTFTTKLYQCRDTWGPFLVISY